MRGIPFMNEIISLGNLDAMCDHALLHPTMTDEAIDVAQRSLGIPLISC
jgi:hypothetical protein